MGRISKIEEQRNNSDRVNIYVDDVFFAGAYKEVVYNLGLKKEKEIDEEELNRVIAQDNYLKGKTKAYQILTRAQQSEKQLRDKLARKGFDPDIMDRVIDNLKEYGMINDEELARNILKDRTRIKKHGKKRVYYELIRKGIDKNLISKVFDEEIDEKEAYENAVALAEKRLKRIKDVDRGKIYHKISQHLAYKGFEYEIIKKAIAHVLEEQR